MSKIAYLLVTCMLVLTAVTVVSITRVSAYDETKFVPYSVLAADQANYGVDENPLTVHAVSPDIIKGKVDDIQSALVKTIEYTSLPTKDSELSSEDNDHLQPQDPTEVHNGYGNDGGSSVSDPSQNDNQSGNQNNNQDQNNNGKGKGKNKDKTKGNNGGGSDNGNSGGNGKGNTNEKSSGNDTGSGNEKVK